MTALHIAAGGIKTPKYIESTIEIQTQSLKSKDLQHLNLTAQQGQYNFVYANGLISAQRRNLDKGEGPFENSKPMVKMKSLHGK